MMYGLPHPIELLQHPPSKEAFKRKTKDLINKYWEDLLRSESETLQMSSLRFLDTKLLSLQKPSTLYLMAGSNSYESSKSLVVAKMISGRYRCEYLTRHWTPSNREGFCLSQSCQNVKGDLTHLLVQCPAINRTRERLFNLLITKTNDKPVLNNHIKMILSSPAEIVAQFLLDPLHMVETGRILDSDDELVKDIFYLTRTVVFYIHKEKMTVTHY